ncbi:3-deoxy-D-manno-octulosonic acid transferase [Thalassococcus sp. CAU 1522]|uniref:3-deoxy-D-manno-octulosonic acid transferase n=1 Tax=Thalassococcus arenae TaxID=2851652 RepID=A0ABS6N7X9_9RHOB|nr:3-deoxy-D-manno-octulosonic acid transferase [Thalassococcus arenae]
MSLRAYLAFARGGGTTRPDGQIPQSDEPRPGNGPVVLAHAETEEAGRALSVFCTRLESLRPEIQILKTGAGAADAPPETPADTARFAERWRPALAFFTGQHLRPAFLAALQETGTRLTLIGARDAAFSHPGQRWLPDPLPTTLTLFDRIFTATPGAARRLRRLGVADEVLRDGAELRETGLPLPVSDRLLEEMSALLSPRPVWLAARLRADEADVILRAHRAAVRLAHRLLLIVVPQDREDHARIAPMVAASGMRCCRWEDGDMPDENTQIVLAEDTADLGLWYRLAPLAFLGGSLVAGSGGTNPLEAAALGTAVLYGPNIGRHLPVYSQLAELGAARIVRDADSLSGAVSQLIAPDRAASMAHAGWDVATAGAALIDAVCDDACEALDAREAR